MIKVDDVKDGDVLTCTTNLKSCLKKGQNYTVHANTHGDLYIACGFGAHLLCTEMELNKSDDEFYYIYFSKA